MTDPQGLTPQHLISFIALEDRLRSARTAEELVFIFLNETHALLSFAQSGFWHHKHEHLSVSGVSSSDPQAPYILWLTKLARDFAQRFNTPAALTLEDCSDDLRDEWGDFLPSFAVFVPVSSEAIGQGSGFIFARAEPWVEHDIIILDKLSKVFAHAWQALAPHIQPSPLYRLKEFLHHRFLAVVACLIFILLFPVRLSVLAPAEIVPVNPFIVRSPLDGVVDKIYVQPNQIIHKGEPILDLDIAAIKAKYDVSLKDLATAEAEYRQTNQQAVVDSRAKAQLAILAGRLEARAEDARYYQGLLARAHILAPADGIILIDDPLEWIGRPVSLGERILLVAQNDDAEIEAWLAISDAIDMPHDASLSLYIDSYPLHPVTADIRYVSYEAILRPNNIMAYRVRARPHGADYLRIGMRGTARLEAEHVPLIYWILRRPLAALRPFIGL
jgi:HlyD family secretion protein